MVSCFITMLIGLLLSTSSHAAPVAGAVDFEIPLIELNKVKKKSPPKRSAGRHKTKKRSDSRTQISAADAPVSPVLPDQAKSPGNEIQSKVDVESAPGNPPAKSSPAAESFKISHDPYSFVVTGRDTVIHAVIYRKADELASVACRMRITKKGATSTIMMKKVDNTLFTYTATLPGLPPEMQSLSYSIVAVDSSGIESVSQEFVTPVIAFGVVPSWQN